MSHPDEGTIQMLLDGELDAGEQARVEAHVETCPACAAKVAEARGYQREADRLVGLLEVPALPVAPPVRRRRPTVLRALAWAASIVLAVSLGYWGRGNIPAPAVSIGEVRGPVRPADSPAALPAQPPVLGAEPVADVPKATTQSPEKERFAEVPTAALPQAPPAARPAEGRAAANEVDQPERKLSDEAARDAAPPAPAAPTWRVITMEEAVTELGGQIRLIDGLAPERVEVGPGTAVAGASALLPVVRVVYAGGSVVLDQQRPQPDMRQLEAAGGQSAKAAQARLEAAQGLLGQGPAWQEQAGIRYVVTGSVPPDSLAALAGRVR